MLGGKNNTGKSSMMEALFFFHDRQNPESFIRLQRWRGGMPPTMTSIDLFAPIFRNYNMALPIELEVMEGLDKEVLLMKMAEKNEQVVQLKPNEMTSINDSHTKSIENNQLEITVQFTGPNKGKFKRQQISHVIHGIDNIEMKLNKQMHIKSAIFLSSRTPINANENAIRYGELAKRNKEHILLKYLQMIEPRLQSITAIQQPNNQATLYGNIGLDVKIPLHFMGDGIMRILSILLGIFTNQHGLVFVDEIENGLHHSVMSQVWEMLDQASLECNCQLFITTHSYECLASLVDSNITKEDLNYIRLERQEDRILSKEYDYIKLQIAIDSGWEVR